MSLCFRMKNNELISFNFLFSDQIEQGSLWTETKYKKRNTKKCFQFKKKKLKVDNQFQTYCTNEMRF